LKYQEAVEKGAIGSLQNKVIMKKALLYLVFAAMAGAMALLFTSCDKDDIRPMVSITGEFTNTPNPAAGFNQVTMPDGSVMTFPKQYIVDGNCNVMGAIDESLSTLQSVNPSFDPRFGFKGEINITLADADGDKLYFKGDFIMFQDFFIICYLRIDGGTGRYENSQGWFNATGQFNPENGVNTITGAGEVTEPEK